MAWSHHVRWSRRPLWVRAGWVTMPDVPLDRLAWLATVIICLVTSLLLLLSGYRGYAGVVLGVAAAAAINLRA